MGEKPRMPFIEAVRTLKSEGPRGLVRRYGWKVCGGVFAYYVVRDVSLYILLPWMIAKGVIAR
jgi:hypothetical protein